MTNTTTTDLIARLRDTDIAIGGKTRNEAADALETLQRERDEARSDRAQLAANTIYAHHARVEAARDAERYRWLRSRTDARDQKPFIAILGPGGISMWNDTSADDAIDAAIKSGSEG